MPVAACCQTTCNSFSFCDNLRLNTIFLIFLLESRIEGWLSIPNRGNIKRYGWKKQVQYASVFLIDILLYILLLKHTTCINCPIIGIVFRLLQYDLDINGKYCAYHFKPS